MYENKKNQLLNQILEADKNRMDIYPLTLELRKIIPLKYWGVIDDMILHWEWGHPVDTWVEKLKFLDLTPQF